MLKPLQDVYSNVQTGLRHEPQRARPTGKGHEYYEREFNKIFMSLKGIFPSMANTIKTQQEYDSMRREWIAAFVENGLLLKQVDAGLVIARKQNTDFLPSVGKFISWSKEGSYSLMGLPTVIEVMREFRKYNSKRLDYSSAELFPWSLPIMYWIVTDLRKNMLQHNQSDLEVEKRAEYSLNQWVKKLSRGEKVPEIRVQIENKDSAPCLSSFQCDHPIIKKIRDRIEAAKRSSNNG
ncbi:replication protein P [Orbus wheelerorum]|uniref:replication protein P n=1 Tax=Orbus wheelerorum TaxID=3074111 RepID=UPI00370D8B8D